MDFVEKKLSTIQHRSRWDIMASVLSVATVGRTKTYVKHKCNLSYKQLRAYMNILCEMGLLMSEFHNENGNSKKLFVTTEKGRAFLKAYGGLRTTIGKGILKFRLRKLKPIDTP